MAGAVSIVDYGMSNLRSVANALQAAGGRPEVIDDPAALGRAERVVLPGVGAFGDGMKNLHGRGWVTALADIVSAGERPVLGICLGMKLLAAVGMEHGEHSGLGFIDGTVARLAPSDPGCGSPTSGGTT